MGTVRIYEYVGEPRLTRGDYGVNIGAAHTRLDDPDSLYVFDPDFGDMRVCAVAEARRLGFRYFGRVRRDDDPVLA